MSYLGGNESRAPKIKMPESSLISQMHDSKRQEVLESFRIYLQRGPQAIGIRVQALLADMIDPNTPEQKSSIDSFQQNIPNLIPKLALRVARWYHGQEEYSNAIETLRSGLNNTDGAESAELMSVEEVNELMNLQITLEGLTNEGNELQYSFDGENSKR
ncbi:hypothetical protein F5X99DRAFT_407135 [Biscogniauxia marginata]|nr:hypothetical protein F5X99DRAFT_407135 [Biscogniauxia marginata]